MQAWKESSGRERAQAQLQVHMKHFEDTNRNQMAKQGSQPGRVIGDEV